MIKFLEKKGGFTMIEVLIVIAIVGMLSVLAVNGYTQYRKTAVLNLAADNLISLIGQTKGKAVHGKGDNARYESIAANLVAKEAVVDEDDGGDAGDASDARAEKTSAEGTSKCFGLLFEKNEAEGAYDLYSFEQDFVGKKKWVPVRGWVYKGCAEDRVPSLEDRELIQLDQDVRISNVEGLNSLAIRFVPPDGQLEVKIGDEFVSDFVEPGMAKFVDFTLNYLNSDDQSRVLKFDFINQNVSKETNQE